MEADETPRCPDCKHKLRWNKDGDGLRSQCWRCNNIKACGAKGASGSYRWCCARCSNDFCRKCCFEAGQVPQCPECNENLKWDMHSEGHFSQGWTCKNFKPCETKGPIGTHRWSCAICSSDFCQSCCLEAFESAASVGSHVEATPAPGQSVLATRRRPSELAGELFETITESDEQPSAEFEIRSVASQLSRRGVALAQLLQFVKENRLEEKKLSTAEVVRDIIIPQTADKKCCYADILPAFEGCAIHLGTIYIPSGPKAPLVLVSHSWGCPFLNTVKAITQFAAGKESFEAWAYSEEQLSVAFWICIFAVNQHTAICGSFRNPCNCGSTKFLPPDPKNEIDKFEEVMQNIEKHIVAMDLELSVLKRVWVLAEIGVGIKTGKNTLFLGRLAEDVILKGITSVPRVQDGEASVEADKHRILAEIEEDIGFDEFNRRVRKTVEDEIKKFRVFSLLHRGSTEAAVSMVECDVSLLQAADMRHDDSTVLHALVQTSDAAEFVQRVLDLRADPNSMNSCGLTPLHVLVSPHGSPISRASIMQSLLQARADPEAMSPLKHSPSDFGRISDDVVGASIFHEISDVVWPQTCPSRGTVERRLFYHRSNTAPGSLEGYEQSNNNADTARDLVGFFEDDTIRKTQSERRLSHVRSSPLMFSCRDK